MEGGVSHFKIKIDNSFKELHVHKYHSTTTSYLSTSSGHKIKTKETHTYTIDYRIFIFIYFKKLILLQ